MFMSVLVFFIAIISVGRSNGTHDAFYFSRDSVKNITFGRNSAFNFMRNDVTEIRSKLCYYAKMKENLAYISHDLGRVLSMPVRNLTLWPTPARTNWLEYPGRSVSSQQYTSGSDKGVDCPTIPKIYLIQRRSNKRCLQITYLESSLGAIEEFDIEVTRAGSPITKLFSDTGEGSTTYEVDSRDRLNLCGIARKHVSPLYFLNHQIPKVEVYKFKSVAGETRVHVAFPCYTLPRVYVILHEDGVDLQKKVEFIVPPSFIDNYVFENDNDMPSSALPTFEQIPAKLREHTFVRLDFMNRKNLCSIVRRYYTSPPVPFVTEQYAFIQMARMYSFEYPSGERRMSLTMLCPALPAVYLRLDDSIGPKIKIKITSLRSSTSEYNYSVEVLPQVIPYTEEFEDEVNKSVVFPLLETLGMHFFNSLTKEDHWNLCTSAQKYILNDDSLRFLFTKSEPIFAEYKLLLMPTNLGRPNVYMLDSSEEADVFIQCSQWPQMYVRRGQADTDIKITLLKYEMACAHRE